MTAAEPLDAALGWEEGDLDEPCPPPTGSEHADRMLYSLSRLRDRIAEAEALADTRRRTIDAWEAQETAVLQRRYDWLTAGLTAWGLAVNADDPTRKTIGLPYGTVAIRPRQPRLEVDTDEEVLRRLAKVRPGWVREKPLPDKNAIKAGVKAGDPVEPQPPDAPAGYRVHWAEVQNETDPETGEVEWVHVAGVVLLVPVDKAVTVTTRGTQP